MAIFYNNFRNNSKNILFFAHLFVPLRLRLEGTFVRKNKKKSNFILFFAHLFVPLHTKAQMAESVDALVSNTSGATHPGSSPGLGTRNPLRTDVCKGFFIVAKERMHS